MQGALQPRKVCVISHTTPIPWGIASRPCPQWLPEFSNFADEATAPRVAATSGSTVAGAGEAGVDNGKQVGVEVNISAGEGWTRISLQWPCLMLAHLTFWRLYKPRGLILFDNLARLCCLSATSKYISTPESWHSCVLSVATLWHCDAGLRASP